MTLKKKQGNQTPNDQAQRRAARGVSPAAPGWAGFPIVGHRTRSFVTKPVTTQFLDTKIDLGLLGTASRRRAHPPAPSRSAAARKSATLRPGSLPKRSRVISRSWIR